MRRCAPWALLLCLLLATGVSGDEESAKYFVGRGEKDLEAKEWASAEKQFRKALSESPGYLSALFGLARSAKGQEKTEEAIGFLETCLDVGSKGTPSEEDASILKRAEDMLKELDRARFEYRKVVTEYVGSLLRLSAKHRKKDPELARRCVERILKLVPGHNEATALLDELGGRAPPEEVKKASAGETLLFNGKDLDQWIGVGRQFRIEDGVIRAFCDVGAYYVRTRRLLEGDYTVELEMRHLKDTGDPPRLAVGFGVKANYDCYEFDIFKDSFQLDTFDEEEEPVRLVRVEHFMHSNSYDRGAWNKYRIEVRKKKVRILVNGKRVFEYEEKDDAKNFNGAVSVIVQYCSAEVRRVALLK